MFDIIIIGAGPAGLTAALYARRSGKTALLIEKGTFGGQITFSPKIENYPGTKQISGNELADMLVEQALEQGAEMEVGVVTEVLAGSDGVKTVKTEDGGEFQARAVIIANGARHRMLGLAGEEMLVGKGISYCAVCDGAFYKDQDVAIVGGGNSALQEAVLLAECCRKVTLIQNLDHFTGEERLLDMLRTRDNVDYITSAVVSELMSANGELSGVRISTADGSTRTLSINGLFIAIGLAPDNDAFASVAELDSWGYFAAGEDCTTATPGIFVAGDSRAKAVRQITTAAADGSVAALAACRYIDAGCKA